MCSIENADNTEWKPMFRSADEKCFLVHHTPCVCCTHPKNVILYSRPTWPLASCLQAAFPPTLLLQFAIINFSFFLPVVGGWSGSFLRL